MKKKSYLALLLAVLMVVSILTGCGAKAPEASTITQAPSKTPAEAPTEAPTEAPVEAPAEEEESNFALGRMEGGVYTNTYAGFGCTLDSNWQFYTAEELQELPANTEELLEENGLGDYTQITDMMAENLVDYSTINILYTQISLAERLQYASMNEEEAIDATLSQVQTLTDVYAQAGIDVISIDKITVDFLGEERFAIKTTAEIEGYPYYILQVQDFHAGAYGVTLTISCLFEDTTDDLLDLFYAVE